VPKAITLTGQDGNDDVEQVLRFVLATQPTHGVITSFDAATGASSIPECRLQRAKMSSSSSCSTMIRRIRLTQQRARKGQDHRPPGERPAVATPQPITVRQDTPKAIILGAMTVTRN